jgi:hypothetical protein
LFNRFKKCTEEGKPKKIFCKGGILKEFFAWGKAKLAYFVWGKNLYTVNKIIKTKPVLVYPYLVGYYVISLSVGCVLGFKTYLGVVISLKHLII